VGRACLHSRGECGIFSFAGRTGPRRNPGICPAPLGRKEGDEQRLAIRRTLRIIGDLRIGQLDYFNGTSLAGNYADLRKVSTAEHRDKRSAFRPETSAADPVARELNFSARNAAEE
jgi:hypothetical protein